MRFRAYSPGSVTLFFEIVNDSKPYLSGSRGVGVCVAPGAVTEIENGKDKVILNGREVRGEIQRYIAARYGFSGMISTTTGLPISQGFGMSGAIALSTSLALAAKFRRTYYNAVIIAHEAELAVGSGLGDVASEYEGKFTVRVRAGIQPYGRVDRLPFHGELKLVVFGDKIRTQNIIKSDEWNKKIKTLGNKAMEEFESKMTIENAIRVSRRFSLSLGLMSSELREFIENCNNATMALLGNAAIVFGNCAVPDWVKTYKAALGTRATVLY